MKILLDTCTILWIVSGNKNLSRAAMAVIESIDSQVFVSSISCAEISCLADRKKITLDRHWKQWFRHYVSLNGWIVLPIDLSMIEEAYSLPPPFHSDPVDRILVATSRILHCKFVTGDSKILNYPHVETLW